MSKPRILLDGLEDGLEKQGKNLKPVISYCGMNVYKFEDLSKKLVQLTKWLHPVPAELTYLLNESRRIKSDRTRVCIVAMLDHKVALFVDDLTNGTFQSLGEES